MLPHVQRHLPTSAMGGCGVTPGFPGGRAVKTSPANAGDTDWIPGSGRFPRGGNGNPLHTPVSLPGKFYGQRSVVGHTQSMGSQRVKYEWAPTSMWYKIGSRWQEGRHKGVKILPQRTALADWRESQEAVFRIQSSKLTSCNKFFILSVMKQGLGRWLGSFLAPQFPKPCPR